MPAKQIRAPRTALPVFRVRTSDQSGSDRYRLRDGHVEFCPSGHGHWRCLTDSDVKLHFVLDTPVGRWLARLTSVAEVTRELLD